VSFLRRRFGRDDVADNGLPHVPRSAPRTGELTLVDAGPRKIEVIKIVRQHTGLGLKEAKDLVDSVPVPVDAGMREALERAGATVADGFVPAPAPAAVAAPPAVGGEVRLLDPGDKQIVVIKIVREATGLGLKEAKDLVDAAPTVIASGLDADAAAALRHKLEQAGARVG